MPRMARLTSEPDRLKEFELALKHYGDSTARALRMAYVGNVEQAREANEKKHRATQRVREAWQDLVAFNDAITRGG